MQQKRETVDGQDYKRFYLQYSFPPACIGETGRVGGVKRREVGHGNLAERGILPCLPSEEEFPYSLRVESLITESHGSTSMASVCGGCLGEFSYALLTENMILCIMCSKYIDPQFYSHHMHFLSFSLTSLDGCWGTH